MLLINFSYVFLITDIFISQNNLQWISDFSNLQGKWKLVRKIGSSKNRRWHQIRPVLPWSGLRRSKKADNNGISLLLMCEPFLFTNKTKI